MLSLFKLYAFIFGAYKRTMRVNEGFYYSHLFIRRLTLMICQLSLCEHTQNANDIH